jgi:hypothetical protein
MTAVFNGKRARLSYELVEMREICCSAKMSREASATAAMKIIREKSAWT